MIDPIAPKSPHFTPDPLPLKPHLQSGFSDSSLTSLSSSFFELIKHLMVQFFFTIKSSIFFWRYETKHHTEFTPEINPHKTLSRSDPFYQQVFLFDGRLKNQKAYKIVGEIFDILGEGGMIHWARYRQELMEKENLIRNEDIHPLESLYLLFHDKEMTKLVTHFLENALFGIKDKFLDEHAKEFEYFDKPLAKTLPGFCQLLLLDKQKVTSFVKKREWKGLILYVYNERKNHFNL